MFQIKVLEKTKTHILGSVILFGKSCRLCEIQTAGQTTDDNMAHVLCVLDN
jgi:hypothetical protein